MPSNLDIAQAATLRRISEVAAEAGLSEEYYEPLGHYKAKLTPGAIAHLTQNAPSGKLILVTATSPTPAGEGKTTVSIGLSQGMRRLGHRAISSTREPALGPIFGVKGGACGGGHSQVLPMEDINLFFTGDFPAIAAAHNLLSAMLDSHIHNGNDLGIDTRVGLWPRTVDMNDRALREIIVGLGGRANGYARETGFVITPASEVMAIFCLATSVADLKERLANIAVGVNRKREPIFARDLRAAGAMAALMRTALLPNLVQTIEGGPAIVHGGPFGNIAHGCSSILSIQCALGMADYTITEAGFGSDLGAEKFMDILVPRLGRGPDAIVLVTTARSVRHHGAGDLQVGSANMLRHVRHMSSYGPPLVVAINRRAEDDPADHQALIEICAEAGTPAVVCDPWNAGGAGCETLARTVAKIAASPSSSSTNYEPTTSLIEKLQALVLKVYGGSGVVLSDKAREDVAWAEKHGFGQLPVCVAKTQYSFSDDAALLNAPEGFDLHVREVRIAAGAGFAVAVCGDIMLMPGLGKTPTAFAIDVDADGKISGLF